MKTKKWQERFGRAKSLAQIIDLVRQRPLSHRRYQIYTRIEILESILKNQKLWLRRSNSKELNDWREGSKFGTAETHKNFFLACFSHGCAEQASMWKMYGDPNEERVRITFSGGSIRAWQKSLHKREVFALQVKDGKVTEKEIRLKEADIRDVVYMAVNQTETGREKKGSSVFCDEAFGFVRETGRDDDLKIESATGWVKDYEWRCENETRVGVLVAEKVSDEQIAIPIPPEVLESMEVTLSPWIKRHQRKGMEGKIKAAYRNAGWNPDKEGFIRESALTNALTSWKSKEKAIRRDAKGE